MGAMAALVGPLSLLIVGAVLATLAFLRRADVAIGIMGFASLIQHTDASLKILGARIYPYQLAAVIGLLAFLAGLWERGLHLRLTRFDLLVGVYLAVNYVAILNSPSMGHAIRVAVLLTILAGVYLLVAQTLQNPIYFIRVFQLLLVAGVAESLYAMYQVLAGALRYHLGLDLPVGFVDVRPTEIVTFNYGQPYGTFQEPAWLGAVTMFYALLFAGLYLGTRGRERRLYGWGMALCLIALFLSLSRGAWAGFAVGLLSLLLSRRRLAISQRAVWRLSVILGVLMVFIGTVVVLNQELGTALGGRFTFDEGSSSLTLTNTRIVYMAYSFALFLERPLLGHGPGNFGIQGFPVAPPYREFGLEEKIPFDLSIITTTLGNTGLVGMAALLLGAAAYGWLQRRGSGAAPGSRFGTIRLSLSVAMLGLFASYVVSTGFWMGYTWVFLGLSVAAARLAHREATAEAAP